MQAKLNRLDKVTFYSNLAEKFEATGRKLIEDPKLRERYYKALKLYLRKTQENAQDYFRERSKLERFLGEGR